MAMKEEKRWLGKIRIRERREHFPSSFFFPFWKFLLSKIFRVLTPRRIFRKPVFIISAPILV